MNFKALMAIIVLVIFSGNALAQNIFRTSCNGNVNRLDSLLQTNPIDIKDNRGRTLLHWAVACRKEEVFTYLVQQGIKLNEEDEQKRTPLHVAVQFGNTTFFNLLIKQIKNVEWKERYGASLLELAILNNDVSLIEQLLEQGVDINIKNDRGSSPLEISERIGAQEASELLIKKGADRSQVRQFEIRGKYMGQKEPGTIPQLFAPNFISTEQSEFGSVFNTEGTEFYFAVDMNGKNEIRYSKLLNNQWTKPEPVISHDRYSYNDPFLSPDENRLYFITNRPLDGKSQAKEDRDIWYVNRLENGWSEPINVGKGINSPFNEYYISFTQEGTMYFSSNKDATEDHQQTDYDIYSSQWIDGIFQEGISLGSAINTEAYEADVFVDPKEEYMIFCSVRSDSYGRGDLYISFKNSDGTWSKAINMGDKINTEHYEYCPFVTRDGKYLFFTSNQDIYWVSTDILNEIKNR